MSRKPRIHFLHFKAPINKDGEGLGICNNFGVVSEVVESVDCKNCINRIKKEIK